MVLCRALIWHLLAFGSMLVDVENARADTRDVGRSDRQTTLDDPASVDPYCGPRCAHEILRRYNVESVELLQCVEELRWNSEHDGVDMLSMDRLLRKHGIYTAAFEAKPGYVLQWDHPAIVHLSSVARGSGHYVVLSPNATRGQVHLWDGPDYERVMSAHGFAELADGGYLLTSPDPIPETVDPFRLSSDELLWRSGLCVLAAFLCCVVIAATIRSPTVDEERR